MVTLTEDKAVDDPWADPDYRDPGPWPYYCGHRHCQEGVLFYFRPGETRSVPGPPSSLLVMARVQHGDNPEHALIFDEAWDLPRRVDELAAWTVRVHGLPA